MAFAALLGFIFLLGLSGRRASKGSYLAIAGAALVAALWEYFA